MKARDVLSYALRYAELGWPVLPVEPHGKRPWQGQGINHASTDKEQIKRWFSDRADLNLGVRLDSAGLLAVDIDPRNGGSLDLATELPPTLSARTGSGGLHLIYRVTPGTSVPGMMMPGVDLKYRGYVVVEPSVHPSGNRYAWESWNVLNDLPPPIAEAPPLTRVDEAYETEDDGKVHEGGRNKYLSNRAYAMRMAGLSIDEILAALRELNKSECVPPLSDEEVIQIARGKERVSPDPEWGDPQPLFKQADPKPYPLDAFPQVIRAAVEEVAAFVQAPIPMVAMSALAALSVASQGHADVERASRLEGPSSLFLLVIADSGERKSTIDGFFTSAIREFEEQQLDAIRPSVERHKAELDAWTAKRDGLLAAIKTGSKQKKPTEDLEKQLAGVQERRPKAPLVPQLLLGDETPENLAWRLAKNWPSSGVISSEAGLVFGSYGMGRESVMRNLALLNILWDGARHSVGRRTSESFVLESARLTVALQVQSATLQDFFDRSGTLARGTGFMARFLIAWPESTQGQRRFVEAPESWPRLELFKSRIRHLLLDPFWITDEGAIKPTKLKLSDDAKHAWIKFHDQTEESLGLGRELYDIRDVASKAADNAARLAALFQVFVHEGGEVSDEWMKAACRIVEWHLGESKRFFGQVVPPQEVADALRLEKWLIDHCRKEHKNSASKNHVRQHVHIELRNIERLESAIQVLHDLNRIFWARGGKMQMIFVNPKLLQDSNAG